MSEDDEKRWLYGQIEALQRKICHLEIGRGVSNAGTAEGGAVPASAPPAVAADDTARGSHRRSTETGRDHPWTVSNGSALSSFKRLNGSPSAEHKDRSSRASSNGTGERRLTSGGTGSGRNTGDISLMTNGAGAAPASRAGSVSSISSCQPSSAGVLLQLPHSPATSLHQAHHGAASDTANGVGHSRATGNTEVAVKSGTASDTHLDAAPKLNIPPSATSSLSNGDDGAAPGLAASLLRLLRCSDRQLVASTLLSLAGCEESCAALRQAGCLPLLVQLLHCSSASGGAHWPDPQVRAAAARALHALVRCQPDGRRWRRETRALRHLAPLREFTEALWQRAAESRTNLLPDDTLDQHPVSAVVAVMKLSFDEQLRGVLAQLGGVHALAELVAADHQTHGAAAHPSCTSLRRFACMALTNLTFGDGTNKSLLCGLPELMRALVSQLQRPNHDLVQVTASVLRNLSWRADAACKRALREVGAVPALLDASRRTDREPALKAILAALWNLSAHCGLNKADICGEERAMEFLVTTLSYESPSKSLAIVENAGGVLRNISSHVAVREDLREVLRRHGALSTLVRQLQSPSLTVVGNAAGTLWNLSARCARDQRALWRLGAVPQLRALAQSRNQGVALASAGALQNLVSAPPDAGPINAEPWTAGRRGDAGDSSAASDAGSAAAARPGSGDSEPGRAQPACPLTSEEAAAGRRSARSPSRQSVLSEPVSAGRGWREPAQTRLADVMRQAARQLGVTEPQLRTLLLRSDAAEWSPARRLRAGSLPRELSRAPAANTPPPPPQQQNNASFHEDDSDHPTDFSARYAEGREEDTCVFKKPAPPASGESAPLQRPVADCRLLDEDTVHTYAEEGTPCQGGTPYVFSTATSLLDLRTDGPPAAGSGAESRGRRVPGASASASASALETPLIFSRSSSVGSLSSFEEAGNATGEHGSVVSEYSRQVSGVVSPSDLPDSPSQMPSSPKPTAAAPHGPTEPSTQNSTSAQRQKAATTGVFEEAPRRFLQEGTPLNFSRATSLSSLTIEEPEMALPAPPPPPPEREEPGAEGDRRAGDGRPPSESGSASEGDNDMIYACIKSAMPTRKGGAAGRQARELPPPPLPPRQTAEVPRRAHLRHPSRRTAGAAAARSGGRYARLSPRGRPFGDLAADPRRHHPQHRPQPPLIERSESDGSASAGEDLLEQMIQQTMGAGKDSRAAEAGAGPRHHRNASAQGASGQSWSVKQYHSRMQRAAGASASQLAAGANASQLAARVPPPPAAERPKQYAVEGTPVNFSRATSLSDLSEMGLDLGGREGAGVEMNGPPQRHDAGQELGGSEAGQVKAERGVVEGPNFAAREDSQRDQFHARAQTEAYGSERGRRVLAYGEDVSDQKPSVGYRADLPAVFATERPEQPTVYATEGTPGVFSRADSLSDICGVLSTSAAARGSDGAAGAGESASLHQPTVYATEGTPGVSRADSVSDLGEAVALKTSHPAEDSRPPVSAHQPTVYATEGTPGVFSRAGSLSDICEADSNDPACQDTPNHANAPGSGWLESSSNSADTTQHWRGSAASAAPPAAAGASDWPPQQLSRPSSLSSLSLHSGGGDGDSATDDMLLERCISSAMPQSRPGAPTGKSRQKRHRHRQRSQAGRQAREQESARQWRPEPAGASGAEMVHLRYNGSGDGPDRVPGGSSKQPGGREATTRSHRAAAGAGRRGSSPDTDSDAAGVRARRHSPTPAVWEARRSHRSSSPVGRQAAAAAPTHQSGSKLSRPSAVRHKNSSHHSHHGTPPQAGEPLSILPRHQSGLGMALSAGLHGRSPAALQAAAADAPRLSGGAALKSRSSGSREARPRGPRASRSAAGSRSVSPAHQNRPGPALRRGGSAGRAGVPLPPLPVRHPRRDGTTAGQQGRRDGTAAGQQSRRDAAVQLVRHEPARSSGRRTSEDWFPGSDIRGAAVAAARSDRTPDTPCDGAGGGAAKPVPPPKPTVAPRPGLGRRTPASPLLPPRVLPKPRLLAGDRGAPPRPGAATGSSGDQAASPAGTDAVGAFCGGESVSSSAGDTQQSAEPEAAGDWRDLRRKPVIITSL